MTFTTYGIEYGVDVEANGNVTGYAWSEIGWIQYNPAGPYPSAPNMQRAGILFPGKSAAGQGRVAWLAARMMAHHGLKCAAVLVIPLIMA